MKRIIVLMLAAIMLTACSGDGTTAGQATQSNDVRYSVTELVGYKSTTYQVHYRTTFSNGLVVDRWTVDREFFEKRRYDEAR